MSGLRGAALLAVACGHVAAMTAGVVPVWAVLPVLGLSAAGAWTSGRAGASAARVLRAGATVVCLVLALLLLPRALGADGAAGPRGVLGPLLVGVMAAQPWTWSRRRELGTALLGAVGLLVLAASFAPDVLVGLPILVGWVAVVVGVVLLDRDRIADDSDAVAVGSARSPRSPVVVPTALATALGLAAFLLVPVPEDAGLQSRLAQQAQQALGSGRAAAGAYSGPRVDLRVRGDLDDDPLIEVPDDSPSLWGSGVYDTWDGSGWTTTEERRRVTGPPFAVQAADGPTRTDQVRVERRARGVVWAPGPVVTVDLQGRVAQVDGYGAVRGDTGTGYAVTSVDRAVSDAELRRSVGADETDPRWLALPTSLPERVRALGRDLARSAGARTTGSGTSTSEATVSGTTGSRIDVVRAVERHLAATARYDLDSPVPGSGEDAVDRFLFVDRVGFCEQFAAAEVLLLRAAGIPARFATGLAYGVASGDRRTFRESDLHAWVEVFHPGVGWVASDPTPPSTQLASASLRVRVAARLTSWLRAADDVPGGRPALALVVLLLTASAAALLRRRRPPVVRPARLPEPVGRPALSAYLRYDARLGALRRRGGESLAEHGARLPVDAAVLRALQDVERECYAPEPPVTASDSARVLESAPPV